MCAFFSRAAGDVKRAALRNKYGLSKPTANDDDAATVFGGYLTRVSMFSMRQTRRWVLIRGNDLLVFTSPKSSEVRTIIIICYKHSCDYRTVLVLCGGIWSEYGVLGVVPIYKYIFWVADANARHTAQVLLQI